MTRLSAPATIRGTSDPQLRIGIAISRIWDGDVAGAETWVRELTEDELRQAGTVLRRLAVLVDTVRFEPLAAQIAVGVEGYRVGGRT